MLKRINEALNKNSSLFQVFYSERKKQMAGKSKPSEKYQTAYFKLRI